MSAARPDEVTQLLLDPELSGAQRADRLLPLIYDQLRAIARQRMAAERVDHTLEPTALVHEAYLRLVGNSDLPWPNRAYFFAAAAEAMRRILIERARRKASPRQGGDFARLDLEAVPVAADHKSQELLRLDEALSELEQHDAQAAALVKLRYFAGMGHQDAADALAISRSTADRLWSVARTWLYQQISDA